MCRPYAIFSEVGPKHRIVHVLVSRLTRSTVRSLIPAHSFAVLPVILSTNAYTFVPSRLLSVGTHVGSVGRPSVRPACVRVLLTVGPVRDQMKMERTRTRTKPPSLAASAKELDRTKLRFDRNRSIHRFRRPGGEQTDRAFITPTNKVILPKNLSIVIDLTTNEH